MPSRAVVDANLVISALIIKGVPSHVFSLNSYLAKFEFIAPEFLIEEVNNNLEKARGFTKLSPQEFIEAYEFVVAQINFVPKEEYENLLPEAEKIATHPEDSPYLALSLAFDCPLISGDKGLKQQSKVKVLSPAEALSLIYGSTTPNPLPLK